MRSFNPPRTRVDHLNYPLYFEAHIFVEPHFFNPTDDRAMWGSRQISKSSFAPNTVLNHQPCARTDISVSHW
ncbi:hypothetical protein St703_26600 [Sporolactobacillus terrae]|uniref:Uncharacterized protein n=1 Tax=Sporolactobacillus terrae TaxID=269673 RepID=A0A5K7WZA7_9BACL|nr:hypothetical protein St703_26600 [Sporolactobacillus terrae]